MFVCVAFSFVCFQCTLLVSSLFLFFLSLSPTLNFSFFSFFKFLSFFLFSAVISTKTLGIEIFTCIFITQNISLHASVCPDLGNLRRVMLNVQISNSGNTTLIKIIFDLHKVHISSYFILFITMICIFKSSRIVFSTNFNFNTIQKIKKSKKNQLHFLQLSSQPTVSQSQFNSQKGGGRKKKAHTQIIKKKKKK